MNSELKEVNRLGRQSWTASPRPYGNTLAVRNRGGTGGNNHISRTTTAHRSRGRSWLSWSPNLPWWASRRYFWKL